MKSCEEESYPDYFERGMAGYLCDVLAGVDDDEPVNFDEPIDFCRENPGRELAGGWSTDSGLIVLLMLRDRVVTAGELRAKFRRKLAALAA